jgi:hypothetical protein
VTHKQRLLAACRGEVPDRIPWVPRLDLWYQARQRAGTLPPQFAGMTLREITEAMGVGYHAVVPDFQDLRSPEDAVDRCLGISRLRTMPFETRLRGVEREVRVEGDTTRVRYHTPAGTVSCAFRYTEEMRRSGVTISWIEEPVLKGPEDVPALAYLFANLEVAPAYDQYRAWQEWVGESGLAVAYGNSGASPVHHILHDLMDPTAFFLALYDWPEQLQALAESMERWFRDLFAVLVESPAEVVFVGANYDEMITYPPLFARRILPWLQELSTLTHRHGKLLLTHTDGENQGLLPLYREAGFDIADSLCPAPMTKVTLAEAIDALPGITIWGGIPSVALLEESMSDADFARLIDQTVALAQGRSHLILGIADTTPAGASWERVGAITRAVMGEESRSRGIGGNGPTTDAHR